ncbi:division plane positioning ATPase MipZ [Parvularcula sp. IMCC14364]|uniref:division plane positioning ATPase MipZ n=1 Tax=Parvularcula sp. IMCC14364 TaxID=3067902 RepID=UPI002741FF75|nr:division plane positioning ATPase MipZ [Parvularcula sp. IMCC14364]
MTETSTHVIVVGNEKGGSGKTTVAMHLIVALMRAGFKTGAMDLDIRQKSLSRYLENRAKWAIKNDLELDALPIPQLFPAPSSNEDSRERAYAQETAGFQQALQKYATCDFLVIDCPGAYTHLSKLAHAHADSIVTPMNDSFIDFDLLAKIDPETGEISGPSLYSEMVWEARQMRAKAGVMGGINWIVMRNRMGGANAHNKKRVGEKLENLSRRIGFKLTKGFGERVVYRELFTMGLTLLDLGAPGIPTRLSSMSHLTAKQEIRNVLSLLRLPEKKSKRARPEKEVA